MSTQLTVAQQFLTIARNSGVEYVFANLGSDHPAFIEAFAVLEREKAGPKVVICPHEMTALSAAHGYAMITRKPQMVLVHVDVGTANLGGSIHNAARGRTPAIIVAGLSPVTLNGEVTGSRTEFVHFLQDTPHQDDIVRPYVKWSYEIRAAAPAGSALLRGIQIASSEPQGPVYLTGAREVWELPASGQEDFAPRPAASLAGIPASQAQNIAKALIESRRALVITSYLGRNPVAVAALVKLVEAAGVGVVEVIPQMVNFPGDHPFHLGYELNRYVEDCDFILLLDVDVPWLTSKVRLPATTRVFHIDCDPLKENLGNWHIPVLSAHRANTEHALQQLIALLPEPVPGRSDRIAWIESQCAVPPESPNPSHLQPRQVFECLRGLVRENTILVVEAPSMANELCAVLRPNRPGGYFSSGGTGLGWGVNAAIGAKLARPDSEVIAVVGDGSFLFSVPSSAFWVAWTYRAAFLAIILNNGGWRSPRYSSELVHPYGAAASADTYWVTMTAGARLAEIAAAAGSAKTFRVETPGELQSALSDALQVVRAGICAVVEVMLPTISQQDLQS